MRFQAVLKWVDKVITEAVNTVMFKIKQHVRESPDFKITEQE